MSMSMEQYLLSAEDGSCSGNGKNLKKHGGSDSLCGFECSICLDLVQDPVVTFCGHLYCWPCIYRWISNYSSCHLVDCPREQPRCPVCKKEVSQKTLIPLYGRGSQTALASRSRHHTPPRPPPPTSSSHHSTNSAAAAGLSSSTTHLDDPMIAMLARNSASLYASYDPNYSYYDRFGSSNNRRLRRHLMQSDESLGRVCFFLCCCAVLCLLLF